MVNKRKLSRDLTLFSITMYGIGSILGAGIYVLIGKASGVAGFFAPISFLVATVIAGFTGFSYARLSSYIPKSGGEFAYILNIFKSPILAQIIALAVMFTGIISSATMANGFVGYLQLFKQIDANIIIIGFICILGIISIYGIQASALVVTIFALIEFLGLLFVLYCLKDSFDGITAKKELFLPNLNWSDINAILSGGFIAFFAFIGFEDMVNVAEEVKNPTKNMPTAIILALIITSVIYLVISVAATLTLSPENLKTSTAPMADLIASKGFAPKIISAVSLFSISNGALVQIVMASRILFSMSRRKMAPKILGHINLTTKTPVFSTLAILAFIVIFALFFKLQVLAELTSFIILSVFVFVNLALAALNMRRNIHKNILEIIFPLIGSLLTSGIIIFKIYSI